MGLTKSLMADKNEHSQYTMDRYSERLNHPGETCNNKNFGKSINT